jgi:nicotinamide-nucleotide amidase
MPISVLGLFWLLWSRNWRYKLADKHLEELIGEMLVERGLTIAVAESCTGGLIGNLLTDVPGSSRYFLGGIIVYSNRSKVDLLGVSPETIEALLGVSPETIEAYGAVSPRTAGEMAQGVKNRFNSHLGLSVTGIAGPDGGTMEKPVGTVFFGLAVEKELFSGGYRFHGDRGQVKQQSASMALDWVIRYLNGDPIIPGI